MSAASRGPLNADVRQHLNRIAVFWLVSIACAGTAAGQETPKRESGDYNFDGHTDYREPSATPGNRCGWWNYYIYEVLSRQHRPVETAFCGEVFDPVDKLVKTYVSGGMAGYLYTIRHFRWVGLKPVAVYVEAQDYDESRDLFIRTKIWNLNGLAGPSASSAIQTRAEVTAEFESRK